MTKTFADTLRFAVLLTTSLLTTSTSFASQTKNIEGVSPRIGQRGTVVEVTLEGVSLQHPREIIFFRPGIRAFDLQTPANPPQKRGLAHGGRIEEAVVCKLEIAPDCALGEHPFRLLTATELTCIGTFHVTQFPVIPEVEPQRNLNDTLANAQSVSLPVTVLGTLGDGGKGDIDVYRVPAVAGQRLSVEVDSARLADVHYGGSEFDLALRVLDEQGRVLAANDDNAQHLQDPLVSVILPQDGVVYVEVTRSVFTQRETDYCVHIGTHRRSLIAYPAGGPAGTQQTFQMRGDPQGAIDVALNVPETEGTWGYFDEAPSPVLLRSSPFPNVLEVADAAVTNVPASSDKTSALRVALNGVISSRDDTDTFRLSVQQGQPLHLRVFSAALGSPLDPGIRLRPVTPEGQPGAIEIEADDAKITDRDVFGTSYRAGGGQKDILDPSILWEPKHDGDYLLEIADSSGAGGPLGVYRIEIEPPRTVVQTVLASRTNDWAESTRVTGLVVPQGNRWTVNLSLPQGQWNSLKSPFDLVARGLPEGVSMIAPLVQPGTSICPVQFVADSTVRTAGAVITLEARPVAPAVQVETRCQQTVPFINHPGGDAWRAVRVDRYILGVTDPAPFTLHVAPPTASLVRGGELAIPVRIERHNGYNGPVEFSVGYVDSAIDTQPATLIPAGESEGVLRLSAKPSAPLGALPLVVIGSTVNETVNPYLGAGHIRVSSEIVSLQVSEPYVELLAEAQSVRRGEQKAFIWKVQHKSSFAGTAQVKLLGLPKGVSVMEPWPVITNDSQEVHFQLSATNEALLGQVTGLSCEVIVSAGRDNTTQRTGNASLRIDPAL